MRTRIIAIALAAPLALAACENSGVGTKQGIGGVLGGVGGAVAGAQFGSGTGQLAATAAGALLGAYLGSEVGRGLDDVDRQRAQNAFNRANTAPVGQTITWNNPNSGNSGTVTPVRDGTASSGEYCREYQTTVYVDGKSQNAHGVACRQADGSWKMVN
ncbi:RT0821/Lpp0805 family surface protein [Oceanibaculum sp.]|uniref:RT0821/Lpp0805 family surface protein n=1 Tax=Oceanibaculum sp. TaxID=1903597 RepID=UPI002590F380|nr:RT0821/Lpp0805 family surface protein [Oceanibaculum sp.]MCH2393856.1 glycine zipper 2TM domain-containing protein [Oceanibaculum sp.]